MNTKLHYKLLLLVFTVFIVSCNNISNEVVSWVNNDSSENVVGKTHFLENDGTKIFLPHEFKRFSIPNYQKVLKSALIDSIAYKTEIKRINSLKDSEGDFYIYFDELSGSTYTIKIVSQIPMSKNEAPYLLGIIRQNNEAVIGDDPITLEKITGKYSGVPESYIFKSIYKLTNTSLDASWFNTRYVVTKHKKTVILNLTTGFEVNFDPYLEKMIL